MQTLAIETLVLEQGFALRHALGEHDAAGQARTVAELMRLLPGKTEAEVQELALRLVADALHRG